MDNLSNGVEYDSKTDKPRVYRLARQECADCEERFFCTTKKRLGQPLRDVSRSCAVQQHLDAFLNCCVHKS